MPTEKVDNYVKRTLNIIPSSEKAVQSEKLKPGTIALMTTLSNLAIAFIETVPNVSKRTSTNPAYQFIFFINNSST